MGDEATGENRALTLVAGNGGSLCRYLSEGIAGVVVVYFPVLLRGKP
jgi:hypothetical protein